MRKITILSLFLLLTGVPGLRAQLQGVNLNSLQNLTGMNQLYSLIPQVMSSAQASSLGFSGANLNPPVISAEPRRSPSRTNRRSTL